MRVLFVNNSGGGLAENVEIAEGDALADFINKKMGPGFDTTKHTITVNGDIATAGQLLEDGDRVSITPTKIKGA